MTAAPRRAEGIRRASLVGIIGLALAGCAAVDPAPRFAELGELVRPATGAPLEWERTSAEAAEARSLADALLQDGLTRSEAIRIALLGNPALQATFEEIGIAEADRVQAGLLTNPSFSLVLAFPLNLGDASATLLGMLSDLWTKPVEEAIAEHALDASLRRVAAKVVGTAAAAAGAYDSLLYWSERVAIERERLALRREQRAAEPTRALHDAEDEVLDQELVLAAAEKDLANARIELEETLGLASDASALSLVDSLEAPPPGDWTAETVVPFAMENRFDVAAAAFAVEGAEQALELERRRVYGEVAVGPSYEGGFGSFDGGGPVVGVDLPIFDQNQAGIARAEFQLRRRRRLLEAARLQARGEVLTALAESEFRRKQAEVHAKRAALSGRLAAEARSSAGGGDRSPPALREKRLTARRSSLDSIAALRRAETDLQRALWGASSD